MLWVCLACTTRYAESLTRCPHCGADAAYRITIIEQEGRDMAKITVHGGPTMETPDGTEIPETDPPTLAPDHVATNAKTITRAAARKASGKSKG